MMFSKRVHSSNLSNSLQIFDENNDISIIPSCFILPLLAKEIQLNCLNDKKIKHRLWGLRRKREAEYRRVDLIVFAYRVSWRVIVYNLINRLKLPYHGRLPYGRLIIKIFWGMSVTPKKHSVNSWGLHIPYPEERVKELCWALRNSFESRGHHLGRDFVNLSSILVIIVWNNEGLHSCKEISIEKNEWDRRSATPSLRTRSLLCSSLNACKR